MRSSPSSNYAVQCQSHKQLTPTTDSKSSSALLVDNLTACGKGTWCQSLSLRHQRLIESQDKFVPL